MCPALACCGPCQTILVCTGLITKQFCSLAITVLHTHSSSHELACCSHRAPADCSIGLSLPFLSRVRSPGPSLQPPMDCCRIQMFGMLVRFVRCIQ